LLDARQVRCDAAVVPKPATRERLLDAAWEEALERGVSDLTLASVGRRAGVSRQAVYLHFGNRATLLVEMTARHDHQSGFRKRLAATRKLDPRDGFVRMLEAWFDYVPQILPVSLALEAAAFTEGDGAEAYRDRMADWRSGIEVAVTRLAEAGALVDGFDVDRATDWTWASIHPTTYHHLTAECGWTPDAVRRQIIGALSRDLVTPNPA
jgi:AcrR family transcriptional regulator